MVSDTEMVRLRSLEVDDYEAFYRWSQDPTVTRYSLSSYAYPQSKSDIKRSLSEINDSPKTVSFGLCCTATDQLIGYAGINDISPLNRSGEYFILIGDKAYWGRGIATLVTRLVTQFGFRSLGLHRIELTAFMANSAAIRAYEKAGYQHEGVQRQAGYRDGQFMDKVMMSALVSEWTGYVEMSEQGEGVPIAISANHSDDSEYKLMGYSESKVSL